MSRYKIGDKVVMEITGKEQIRNGVSYILSRVLMREDKCIDECAEPLSAYTEPLKAKIRRRDEELEKLKEEPCNPNIDKLLEQARAEGQNEAWELARKTIDDTECSGFSLEELEKIFGIPDIHDIILDYTYQEVAAKVEAYNNSHQDIQRGDVVVSKNDSNDVICVIDTWPGINGLHFEGIGSNATFTIDAPAQYYTKTGRHIDVDGLLKQIKGDK